MAPLHDQCEPQTRKPPQCCRWVIVKLTRRQKLSIQTQVSAGFTLPLQGDWYTCFTAVTAMSDTALLPSANGTLIHCRKPSREKEISGKTTSWSETASLGVMWVQGEDSHRHSSSGVDSPIRQICRRAAPRPCRPQSTDLPPACRRWRWVPRSPPTAWCWCPRWHWESPLRSQVKTKQKNWSDSVTHQWSSGRKHERSSAGHLPRADKMAADQKISPISAGMKRRPPIRLPYSCWKGSSMVT